MAVSKAPFMGSGSTMGSSDILQRYENQYNQARQANLERYGQGIDILKKGIERYQPGGQFGAGAMALYEQGKNKALASGMQNLVGSGLANTTVAGTLPLAYEQEVGSPFRLQLEDMRLQNLTGSERAMADFISARNDPYPDLGMFANLAMQAGQGGGGASGGASFGGAGAGWSGDLNTWEDPNLARAFGQSDGSKSSMGGMGMGTDLLSMMYGNSGISKPGGKSSSSMSLGSQTSWDIGRPKSPTSTSQTPGMDEEEYQKLLMENLALNNGGAEAATKTEPKKTTEKKKKESTVGKRWNESWARPGTGFWSAF